MPKVTKNEPEQAHHYYAATGQAWGVGLTRQAAIAQAASLCDADTIKRLVKSEGGMYVWTCRVELPKSARYSIAWFKPEIQKDNGEPVPLSRAREFLLVNSKGHVAVPPDEFERVESRPDAEEIAVAAAACIVDLDHYVSTHGPGPDVRLAALKAVLAKFRPEGANHA